MNVMKIKNYLSVLSLAAGLAAAPQVVQAEGGDGDIVDIRVMDIDGRKFGSRNQGSSDICSVDNPVIAGQTICLRVRLRAPNAYVVQQSCGAVKEEWQIKTAAGGDVLPGVGPALGIKIGNVVRWAEYSLTGIDETCQFSGELHYMEDGTFDDGSNAYACYTDFYFKYVVQAGDMGLPVRLIDENLNAIDPTAETPPGSAYAFRGINAGVTGLYNIWVHDTELQASVTAELKRRSAVLDVDWPGETSTQPVADYSLETEGAYVKTVDFDTDYVDAENKIWRTLNKSGWKGNDATFTVAGGVVATNTIVYVWSSDKTVAVPVVSQNGTKIITQQVAGEDVDILEVQIPAGASSAKFKFKSGGASVGTTCTLYMSPVLGSVYTAAGELKKSAVSRTVRVAEDSPPGVCVRLDGATTARVTADTDYSVYKVKLNVRVDNDAGRTKPTTVYLKAYAPGDSSLRSLTSLYSKDYLRISTEEGFSPTSGGCQTTSVSIPADESSVDCFVYVLGSNEYIEQKGIDFYPMFGEDGAEIGYASTSNAVLYVDRLGEDPGITVTKISPTTSDESVGTISMASTDKKQIQVWFNDCYRNMNNSSANTYTFYLKGLADDYDGETFAEIQSVYKLGSPGYCKFNLQLNKGDDVFKVKENRTYSVELYGLASDGSSETTHMKYTLKVIDGKTTTIRPAGDSAEIGEGETMQVKLGLNQETDTKRYIFVAGVTDKDKTLFTSSLTTQGAPLGDDYQTVTSTKPVKFLDGNESGTEVNIEAILSESIDDPTDVTAGWAKGTLSVTVTNKPPVPKSLTIAGIPVTLDDSGSVLEDDVPMGIVKTFKLNNVDEVAADWARGVDVKWTIDGVDYYTENAKSAAECVISTNFTAMTTAGKKGQRVEVRLKDKDMDDYPADPNFYCYVNVVDKPSIAITTGTGEDVFNEDEKNMKIVVTLSEAPKTSVPVILRVQKKSGKSKINLFETDGVAYLSGMSDTDYDYYRLTYQYGVSKSITVSSMDGTHETDPGIEMVAYVEEGEFKDYFSQASFTLSVRNVPPTIVNPSQEQAAITNYNAAIDTPYEVGYRITDVSLDLTNGIDVVISIDGKIAATDKIYDTLNHTATITFSETGAHNVEFKFTDKDHTLTGLGESTRTCYYYVEQSKVLYLRAHGPASSTASSGGYSVKYHAASGLGQGFVYAEGSGPKKVDSFVHHYSYNKLQDSVTGYAQGYKVGDIDDGSLWTGHDQWINAEGNWSQDMTKGVCYDYSLDSSLPDSPHKGAKGLDSFVYGWACDNSEASKSSDSGTESFMLSFGTRSSLSIPLPDDDSSGTSSSKETAIPIQYWEAIFSSELLASDNCGDINSDGVPDLVVQHSLFDVIDDTGKLTGNDLRDLNYSSEDASKPYCVEGEDGIADYLPTTDLTVYDTYIPGLPESWQTSGKAFTPQLKLRGFADENIASGELSALNDALNGCKNAPSSSLNLGIESDRVYTNPKTDDKSTLSYVEWLAWSEFKAANPSATEKDWSPENPTDPMKADTDNDGIYDGYEYWTWYMAHVGWVENYGTKNEIHKRLTGRAYDPANPGQGKRLSSDYIAKMFNPNSSAGALTRDTDNDGLPDVLEVTLGTKPYDFDTDGDGLPDGWEVMIAGLDPAAVQTYANETSDRELNMDGDAMAISSYKLEQGQQPVSLKIEESKRWTLAVKDAGGMTDGVQWYAATTEPKLVKGTAITSWCKLTIGDDVYMAESTPAVTEGNCLAVETTVYKVTTWAPPAEEEEEGEEDGEGDGQTNNPILLKADEDSGRGEEIMVKGYPVILEAGTQLDAAPEETTEELNVFTVEADVEDAYGCWIYGAGSANALEGEVAASAAEYGCLAMSRKMTIPAGAEVYAYPQDDRDVAFLHYLCYQEFGFDPRTAWSATSPLASRWGDASGKGKYTGIPARTRNYTAYDEFLVSSFFYNNAGGWPSMRVPTTASGASDLGKRWAALTTNPQGPVQDEESKASSDDDDDDDTAENYAGRNSIEGADTDGDGVPDGWELYVMAGPKVKDGNGILQYVFAPPYAGFQSAGKSAFPESSFSPFIDSASSSDTCNPAYTDVTAESTQLTELRKFAGTDSCNYYSTILDGNTVAYSTTIVRPTTDEKWLNKFFPADPWTADTDNDGVSDGTEGKTTSFIYGSPADNGSLKSIPGGGLNPLTVDTDLDGLPDGWELQFKGSYDSLYSGDEANYAKDSDDNEVGNALQGLTDGMDGTVADAFSYPVRKDRTLNEVKYVSIDGVSQVVDRDYDHDGLDNWQEYLTGTMRCWRYDDPVSPLNGIPYESYYKTNEEGKLVFDAATAAKDLGFADENEFWGKTLVDSSSEWYNPHFVTGTSSGAQYFSRVENVWDRAYLDVTAANGTRSGTYYWFYWLGNGEALGNSWSARWEAALGIKGYDATPAKYASCSPIDPDSDHDGMDDYYELFHGMNPLLGLSGVAGNWVSADGRGDMNDGEGVDLVYDSLVSLSGNLPQAWGEGDSAASYKNFWQRLWDQRAESKTSEEEGVEKWEGPLPRGTGYDFVFYPWLNGLATADADGDGTRNQEEGIMPLVAPTTAWHHTDPTALWMTDSSYSNSLVRTSYRMPVRTEEIPLSSEGFTYNETDYFFKDFDGYLADLSGVRFVTFNPDQWSVATSQDKMNWIASFEENEGYDTDHDGLSDSDELAGKFRGLTDPIDTDSPRRRQAMYFQGEAKPSILQTMPFVKEQNPDASAFNTYPDDMSLLYYTVECWVRPDNLNDATILERAMWTDQSNPADKEFIRCNFRLGIKGGKWITKFDPNDTTKKEVVAESDIPATAGEWTHLAATYDGSKLLLYVNGVRHGLQQTSLQPAYGSSAVTVDGMSGSHALPGMTYWRDREYKLNAIVIGASFKNCSEGATDGTAFDVTRGAGWSAYNKFFQGYIDEIRVWDGARTASEISSAMYTRFTSDEVEENRTAFYTEWIKGTDTEGTYRGRYAKDGSGNAYEILAELRFHWTFDSVYGAGSENMVAKVPSGFNYTGEDGNGGRAMLTRPDGYGIAWWEKILSAYTDTVYNDKAWIVWIPNTVTHLPRFDGTTLDSRYWSDTFAGDASGKYKFARTAEPVSFWTQYRRDGIAEADLAYSSTGSRSFFVNDYDYKNNAELTENYQFTGRHLNQTGDDMLALGGAYVKHIDTMWDSQGPATNWEISGSDNDGDGLPDWWEKIAERSYLTSETGKGAIGWDTVVVWPDQSGTKMTAGEAYMRDLARGYHANEKGRAVADDTYRQRYDIDGNGIPDWWEEIYCISGADKNADSDKDGLSDYVEFMLSEVFTFSGVRFSPINPFSADPYTLDYFYKVGQLYVGEIFTDHDQVEDAWEDLYPNAFGSRLVFDAFKDEDQDGWSNRSEVRYSKMCMPTFADKQTHYTVADGLVADYPIPTLAITLTYNGANRAAAQLAPIVVRVKSGQVAGPEADAEYVIGELDSIEAGAGSDEEKETDKTENAYVRTLGKWSNRHVVGTLTPGYINQDSVSFQYSANPTEQVYTWQRLISSELGTYEYCRGTRAEYDEARRIYGSSNVSIVDTTVEYYDLDMSLRLSENSSIASWIYTSTGDKLGTVDLVTGAFDIDLGVLAGQKIQSPDSTNETDLVSLEDMSYRIGYSTNPSVDLPRKLYLGQATTGHVREGKNTVEAFMDMNNNGEFDPGEPYGVAKGVDISWKGTSVGIELTTQSPVTPRMSLWTGSWASTSGARGSSSSSDSSEQGLSVDNDRADTVEGVYARFPASKIDDKSWQEKQTIATPTLPTSGDVRVRVVRWLVDGYPVWLCGVKPTVVFDEYLSAEATQAITEDDFLSESSFDLDWANFKSEVVDCKGMQMIGSGITEVDYLVVIGDGETAFENRAATNSIEALSQVIVRKFGSKRVLPQPVSPSVTSGQVVRDANPTFMWSVDEDDLKGYTAFKIQVNNASGTLVYDSGIRHVPPRNDAGNYVWTAPLYTGDKTTLGQVYANNAQYTWKVSMYNAKYAADSFSGTAQYLQSVQTNGLEFGTAEVAVKYFGPVKSFANKIIRVRAYESPDFTGNPVAAGYVAEPDDEDSGVAVTGKVVTANCRLIGIPAGTYFLQAFIDSNGNGICDDWESSGYLCSRDGSTDEWLTPTTVTFGTKVGPGELATIYLEDADTDGDSLPDAWEYAEYGSLTSRGVALASVTDVGELVVSKSLTGNLSALPENDVNGGLAAQVMNSLAASPEMVALVTGVEIGSVEFAADGTIISKSVVEEGSLTISDFAFDATAKKASFNVAAKVAVADEVSSPFYTIEVQRGAVVTVRVLHTDTLAGEWVEVGSKTGVTIGEEGLSAGVVTVDLSGVETAGGFFKVVVEQ